MKEECVINFANESDSGIVDLPVLNVTHAENGNIARGFNRHRNTVVHASKQTLEVTSSPVRRNLAEPGDTGGAEGGARVEAAVDGTGDERVALLGQQPEHPLLRRH